MTATTIRVQMAQRKDTAANWTAANPILLSGEIGYETDTKKFKIGNGSTNWNSLAYLPIPDGSGNLTITGNLEIGSTGSLTFEGSTADGFETTLAVTNPTADRTITLPDVTGTVVTTGDTGSVTSTMIANGTIVDADVSSTAEIAVSKLANGTANQVIVTDGTNVSWSDNLTLAGDLTVNGTTTTINTQDLLVEDKNIIIGNVATPSDVTADGGGITLKGATDKTINWVDATDAWTLSEHVNIASGKEYRIDGTKVLDATSLGSAVVSSSLTSVGTITSGTWQGTAINATYLDSTVVKTSDTGTVTSAMLADGTIVDGDISATAEIAVSKLADGDARQLLQTDAAGTGVEWASNIDIPGTLDVTGAATFDSTVSVTGALTKSGSDVVTVGDTGTVTSTMILDGTIVNADVNASAAIAGTKISPNFGSQNVVTTGTSTAASFIPTSSTAPTNGVYLSGTNTVGIATNSTGRLFIDSSGRLLVGTSTARSNYDSTLAPALQIESTAVDGSRLAITRNTAGTGSGALFFGKSRGASNNTNTVVQSGDALGSIEFLGADGSNMIRSANIAAAVDGTPGANDMPGRLVFSTTADGANNPTERMRIDSSGRVGIGTTSPLQELHIDDATGVSRIRLTGGAVGANNFEIGQSIPGVSNSGFSIYDLGATASRLVIDSSGRVGIGTTSPGTALDVNGAAKANYNVATGSLAAYVNSGGGLYSYHLGSGAGVINAVSDNSGTAGTLIFNTGSERARLDSSGRLLVGTSTARANFTGGTRTSSFQVEGTTLNNSAISILRNSNDTGQSAIYLAKSRSTAVGDATPDIVADGDSLGSIFFQGADNTNFVNGASITAQVDGTPGANDMPGRIVLATTLDGATASTERFRITNDGVQAYNQPAPAAVDATATLTVANLKTGIITSTSAAATDMTLPTGTNTEAGFSGLYDNFTFEWSVINTGPSLVTVLAGTAHTIVGSGSVATGTSGRFASRRTAVNTFVTYRLS